MHLGRLLTTKVEPVPVDVAIYRDPHHVTPCRLSSFYRQETPLDLDPGLTNVDHRDRKRQLGFLPRLVADRSANPRRVDAGDIRGLVDANWGQSSDLLLRIGVSHPICFLCRQSVPRWPPLVHATLGTHEGEEP